jgi:hypothetical protein
MSKIEETVLSRSADSKRFIPIFSASGFVDYYFDSIPGSANYYQVELKDETGNKYKSLPYMVIMEDSIPPALPLGVLGECDSLGVIKLGWHPNSESDLAGYRVYRSKIEDGEYRQITSSPSTQSVFYDTVNLKSLTRDIYYSIEAVDLRGNRSSKSLPTKVRVYDLVPPTPPRILGFTTDANRVSIKWTESSSDDVEHYLLHKTSDNDRDERIKVFRSSDGVTNILLDSVKVAGRVEYYLTAVDSSNNESAKSNAILVNLENAKIEQSIFAVKVDRNKNLIVLSWTMPFYASQIRLYRATGDNPLSLYKSLSGDREAFVDSSLTINAEYTYVLQFIDIDSRKSSFSNELKVLF